MSIPTIVAGNWKMNLDRTESVKLARAVAEGADKHQAVQVAVFPSLLWTAHVADALKNSRVSVGVQDCYTEEAGAFTGEVSPVSAATVCAAALVGHSERRHVIGESDELIAAKLRAVLHAGMTGYLCVGETLDEREDGQAREVTTRQLGAALDGLDANALDKIVIAYEPVWAIGTGVAATPDDAQEMCAVVRDWLVDRFGSPARQVPVLYGGSVNADNAPDLFGQLDVNGGLIGGASLDASAFTSIIEVAAQHAL